MLTSIAAVAIWEAARCFYRVGNRWMRKYRKAKRLAEVSQLASSVARREIATSSTSKALPSTPRLRRRSTEVTTQSVRATPPTASSATPTPSTPMSPLDAPPVLPPLPQFRGGSRQREVDETQEERERVAFDTLQLMFSEDLRTGLRLEGLPVSGLKEDLARRLSVPLVASDVTNKQLRYVLFLWRSKSLSGRCKLRWEDLNTKQRVSRWIATWKDS